MTKSLKQSLDHEIVNRKPSKLQYESRYVFSSRLCRSSELRVCVGVFFIGPAASRASTGSFHHPPNANIPPSMDANDHNAPQP